VDDIAASPAADMTANHPFHLLDDVFEFMRDELNDVVEVGHFNVGVKLAYVHNHAGFRACADDPGDEY
jgi:hypothetical protein